MTQRYRHGHRNFIDVRVAYGVTIAKGDLLKLLALGSAQNPAQYAIRVTGASDNDTFFAIADQAHTALSADDSKIHTIRCVIPEPSAVYEYPLGTATNVIQGMGLSMTDHESLDVAATDHVAMCVERKTSTSGMTVKVVFLVPPLWGGASKAVSYTAATW